MLPAVEDRRQKEYRQEKGSCLLCDYIALEVDRTERIVAENADFVALVPFWAVWPFEIMIAPKGHFRDIAELEKKEKKSLSDILSRVCIRYDNLFMTSFPYSMGIHQRPTDGLDHEEWHFHFHFYPPLLRSATVKKFMVGYELLAQPQRDITAEQSAFKLRECSETHYMNKRQ
jgi:UDPglucose--hexose-1-phosphate uridylyltransferase